LVGPYRERHAKGIFRCFQVCCAFLLSVVIGCGSIQASSAVGDAEDAIEAAEREEVARFAQYEYWMAVFYLDKAKRVDGRADFHAAETFAAEATRYATSAVEVAAKERRRQDEIQKRLKHRQGATR